MFCFSRGCANTFERTSYVLARIQAVHFGCNKKAIKYGIRVSPRRGIAEKPIAPSYCKWPYQVVNEVVVQGDVAIFKKSRQLGPLVHWSIGPLVHWSIGPLVQRVDMTAGSLPSCCVPMVISFMSLHSALF